MSKSSSRTQLFLYGKPSALSVEGLAKGLYGTFQPYYALVDSGSTVKKEFGQGEWVDATISRFPRPTATCACASRTRRF